jgi:hypothetical protein
MKKPPWIIMSDVSKGGAIQGFGPDVSKPERDAFKQVIKLSSVSVLTMSILLLLDLCLILLYSTGASSTFASLELPPKTTIGQVAIGVGFGLVLALIVWTVRLGLRKPQATPSAAQKTVAELWGQKQVEGESKEDDGDNSESNDQVVVLRPAELTSANGNGRVVDAKGKTRPQIYKGSERSNAVHPAPRSTSSPPLPDDAGRQLQLGSPSPLNS